MILGENTLINLDYDTRDTAEAIELPSVRFRVLALYGSVFYKAD